MFNYPIILCGSGGSIPFLNSRYNHNRFSHGLDMKLETLIKGNYSIGLNYFFRYGCPTTFNTFADWQFYLSQSEALKKLPLIIGANDPQLKNHNKDLTHENTILLEKSGTYNGKDSISKGCFSKQLIGIWSLSLTIALGFKEIYLLGYDCCETDSITHFYQGVVDMKSKQSRGIGKNEKGKYNTSTYNIKKHLNEKWFAPFEAERKEIKIYNVSPDSAIKVFEKIDYDQFYQKVQNNHIDQTKARREIRQIIQDKLK